MFLLTTPAVAIFLVACVEHAFADFARIPYYDGAARRELEEMLDDLKDLTSAQGMGACVARSQCD